MTKEELKDVTHHIEGKTSLWRIWVTEKIWDKMIYFPNDPSDDIIRMRTQKLFSKMVKESQENNSHHPDIRTINFRYSPDDFINYDIKMIVDLEKRERVVKMRDE